MQKDSGEITIEWKDSLPGDFSFKDEWSYKENVFKNEFGELICDGFCEENIDRFYEKDGHLKKDSITAFYKILDTTHVYHSLKSETNCYEWGGSDDFKIVKVTKETFDGFSSCNAGTHASLKLVIEGDKCLPLIELKSVMRTEPGTTTYHANGGQIQIDKGLLQKGILKAEFNFNFDHQIGKDSVIYWKGKIFAYINK